MRSISDLDSVWTKLYSDKPKDNQPVAIVVHDTAYGVAVAGALFEAEYFVRLHSGGASFIDRWRRDPDYFQNATSLLIHKDLGDRRGIVRTTHDSTSAQEVIDSIRNWSDGWQLRTFALSGEFTDKGVSEYARHTLKVDVGYDPTSFEGVFPGWVGDALNLGQVSEEEATTFRGRQVITNWAELEKRKEWLAIHTKGPEAN